MAARLAHEPFSEELPQLLRERGMTLRALAAKVDVNPSHLSRIVNRSDYKTPSVELMRRVADVLDLDEDYFIESRVAMIMDRVKRDPPFRERVYRSLKK